MGNEQKLELYHQIARHVWAILLIIAELHVGIRPNWKNKSLGE